MGGCLLAMWFLRIDHMDLRHSTQRCVLVGDVIPFYKSGTNNFGQIGGKREGMPTKRRKDDNRIRSNRVCSRLLLSNNAPLSCQTNDVADLATYLGKRLRSV